MRSSPASDSTLSMESACGSLSLSPLRLLLLMFMFSLNKKIKSSSIQTEGWICGKGEGQSSLFGLVKEQNGFWAPGRVFGFRIRINLDFLFILGDRVCLFSHLLPSWYRTNLFKPQCQINVCLITYKYMNTFKLKGIHFYSTIYIVGNLYFNIVLCVEVDILVALLRDLVFMRKFRVILLQKVTKY